MKFSVLLSLYYKESALFLHDCLESIASNTCAPDQIVIVFDGYISDDLLHVVNEFSSRLPIDIVRLSNNVGLGKALNHGLQYCRNELIFRMDTDDICLPERFALQLSYMKSHPEVVLLGSAIEEFDNTMKIRQGKRFSVIYHEDIKKFAKKRNPFNHMTVVFRKSVIEKLSGYQHHYLMEDYNLWLRILAADYRTHNLSEVLVNVRAGRNMLCRRKGYSYIKSEILLAKLKYELQLDNLTGVIYTGVIRIIPRILPVSLLKLVYNILRK
ncbi:TPA: glycosyltransferase [Escherichia coli]|uniref:glycosyltransferase n=1 Tax=Escherichia coli TaxID=562 RepID=UPI000BE57483|nr:glycosyltransferase [Escherichia coli]HAV8555741.1 glycosyltransferase [Escherichia coli]